MQVDCALYLANCSHDTLFLPSYVRCQKSQGQKILRCFPHCCPRHIHYRNCGCSVSLQVETAPRPAHTGHPVAVAAVANHPRALVAYAKFSQLDEDVDWAVHDVVPAAAVLNDLRSRDTPFRTWIPGHVEWTKGNTWSFQFDEKKGDGWHYGWKSGRSRSQRTSAHVLKAFVFEASRDETWQVVGVTSSTPFTITSYRGEHNKKKKVSISGTSSSLMHQLRQSATSTSSPSIVRSSGTSSEDEDDPAGAGAESARAIQPRRVSSASSASSITASSISTRATGYAPARGATSHNMPLLSSLTTAPEHRDIAHLFGLLHVLEASDCPPSVWAPFEASWMAAKGFGASGRPVLPHFYHPQTSPLLHRGASPHLETALALCLHLISSLWDVSDRIQEKLIRHGEAVLDKQQALRVYDDCMGVLHGQVMSVLSQKQGDSTTVKELLRHLPPVPTTLMSPSNHLYRLFVAQMRETFIATQHDQPVPVEPTGQSGLDGTWVYLPQCAQFTTWSLALSLMGYLRWTSNLAALTLARSGRTVQIRSTTPWFVSVPMTLELDQAPHSVRVLPSGESCLAGTLAIDYIGQATDSTWRLELYVFGLTTVHVVFVEVVPHLGDPNSRVSWVVCRVHVDEIRRDGNVGQGDEASMDAATRIAWAQQLAHRTTVVQMVATFERAPGLRAPFYR